MNPTHTPAIRLRTLEAMEKIIRQKRNGVNKISMFAAAIGTTSAAISRWRNGVGSPTVEDIANLCIVFDQSAQWIITGTEGVLDKVENLEKRLAEIEKKVGMMSGKGG